jgi:ATP-binding cassette subfamily C protein CydC
MGLGSLLGLVTLLAGIGLLALSGWFISAAACAGLGAASAAAFNFFRPGASVRFFAILRTLGRYGERVINHDATLRLLAGLRVWFYDRLEPLAPACLQAFRGGDLLSRIVADIDALDNLYLRVLVPTLIALLMALLVLVFLWFFDPWIALAAFALLMLSGFAVPALAGYLGAGTGQELTRTSAALRVRIVEGIQGVADMLVFGAQQRYLGDLAQDNGRLMALQRRMSYIEGLSTALITLLSGFAIGAVLYLGVALVPGGELNGANLALIGFAVLAAFEGIMPLPLAYQYLGRTREAARRLLAIVDTEPEVRYPARTRRRPQGFAVTFEQVSFRYRSEAAWVLRDIDLALPEGRRVALVGPTGSGKSTLASLMVRFWDPTAGTIHLGGVPLGDLVESDLRRYVSLIAQRPHIFNASLRDNLRLARPEADEAELRAALEAVQLLDFVEDLPEGLDTLAGELGTRLSGGQIRRLAVARAVLRDTPVLILDEPTEGLDAETERQMLLTLERVTVGRTLLMITHRTAGLARMDDTVVLEGGRIVG